MSSYTDLDIYHLSHNLGVPIHKLTLKLPKQENYEIGSQLRRSSKAISANIIEGYGRRRYKADFIRFLVYAHSSCGETLEWMKYIQDCYPELSDRTLPYIDDIKMLGRKLNNFLRAVETKHQT